MQWIAGKHDPAVLDGVDECSRRGLHWKRSGRDAVPMGVGSKRFSGSGNVVSAYTGRISKCNQGWL